MCQEAVQRAPSVDLTNDLPFEKGHEESGVEVDEPKLQAKEEVQGSTVVESEPVH